MQRTQPAIPGVTLPTAPVVVPHTPIPAFYTAKSPRKRRVLGSTLLRFFLLGVFLECLYLALYPLFAAAAPHGDALQAALLSLFPWISKLYWSNAFPFISSLLSPFPLLNPDSVAGSANLQLLLFAFASMIVLLAFTAGLSIAKERLTTAQGRVIFWLIFLFAAMFGITFLLAPVGLNAFSQNTLLYALYGRMVVFYHVNPYIIAPLHSSATLAHDSLLTLLGQQGTSKPTQAGPVWLDLSLLVALCAGNSLASTVLAFRLLGLATHVVNVALLWAVLTKVKPEANSTSTTNNICISATLLYAWNPLVLLWSVSFMHFDTVVVTFLLLALFFYQRSSLLIGWAFTLLAVLVNPFCLLLLPIFFRFIVRESRMLRRSGRMLWWIGVLGISALVVILAYAPYWPQWSFPGMLETVRQTFLQDTAVNSIDAALLHLPMQLPAAVQWIISPPHWSVFALSVVGLFLLFAIWLADTLELALLFNGWLLLLLVVLLPTFWPSYLLPSLILVICTGNRRILTLLLLLCVGGLVTYYTWLWPAPWASLGLVTMGIPLLLWGWVLFFTSTWHMTNKEEKGQPRKGRGPTQTMSGISRPAWLSRPSRPGKSQY